MRVRIPLTDMGTGEMGTVVDFLGGRGLNNRLMSLGIRPGVKVNKVSSAFGRGPVVIQVGNAQTALGFGMSYKVIVEVER
jgi:ferrous iron transport protein A